jgi:Peptidase family M28
MTHKPHMQSTTHLAIVPKTTRKAWRSAPLTPAERSAMLANIKGLQDILSWRRPHDSNAEFEFIRLYLVPLNMHPNVTKFDVDLFGNVWLSVGQTNHNILYSCHIDTVSKEGGRQAIGWKEDEQDVLCLVKQKAGRSLGADDGAGLWLLLQMISANTPGRYVFHRGEEVGRLGSRYVAEREPERLEGVEACIAFDRKDHDNLITHQMYERGCSKLFGLTLSDAIFAASNGSISYQLDDTGSYTDSYSYFHLVPECTNLSVGYDGEHGPRETLDVAHLWRLRNAMCQIDLSGLVIERDPKADDSEPYGGFSTWWNDEEEDEEGERYYRASVDDSDLGDMETLVCNYPLKAAEMLLDLGVMPWDFIENLSSEEQGRALGSIGL